MLLAVAQAAQAGFTAPHLDYHALAPEIVLSVVLAAVLLADLVLDETKKWVIPAIASFGLLATFVPIITLALYGDDVRSMVGGAYVVDNFALVLKALFIGVGYVVLLHVEHLRRGGRLLRGGVLLPPAGLAAWAWS